MKKLFNIAAGLLTGIIIVLFVNPFIQEFIAGLSGTDNFWVRLIIVLIPLFLSVIFIEISLIILSKIEKGDISISLIGFQIVNTGFLLVYIISAVISVVLENSRGHSLVVLLRQSGYSYIMQLIFMLATAALLFGYINFILRRMKKDLPTVIENKNRKAK